MSNNMTNKRLDQLDTLRFFSMVLIVFNHVWGRFNYPHADKLTFFYDIGTIGNYMFFMISGLLIGMKYKDKIKNGLGFGEFFGGRYLSIFPMYAFSVVLQIIVLLMFGNGSSLTVKNLVLEFLMIPCGWTTEDVSAAYNIPTWFIAVLLLCYIIYYAIVKLSKKHPSIYIFAITFMVVWGLILMERSWDFPFNFRINGEGYANFFLGVLLGEIYVHTKELKYEHVVDIILAVILGIIVILSAINGIGNISGDLRWTLIILDICILYLSINIDIIGKVLAVKPLAFLGRLSMEMCFLHIPLAGAYQYGMYNIRRIFASDTTNMFVYAILLLVFSLAFHYGFSTRVNLKKLFVKK